MRDDPSPEVFRYEVGAPKFLRVRLDFGEFQVPGHPEPNWWARNWFLLRVNENVPEVRATLKEQILPVYRQLDVSLQQRPRFSNDQLQHDWAALGQEPLAEGPSAARGTLIHLMSSWAKTYQLDVPWVLNRALATLHVLLSSPDYEGWQGIDRSGGHQITEEELLFQFTTQGWVTTTWRRVDYEPLIHKAFTTYLKAYLDRVEAEALKRGLVRTGEWRKRKGGMGKRFDQLVRWQVQGWTLTAIANEAKTSIRTVRSNLVSSAREIGLRLRPGLPGRPPKDRSSS